MVDQPTSEGVRDWFDSQTQRRSERPWPPKPGTSSPDDCIPCGCLTLNPQWRIEGFDERCEILYDLRSEDILGRDYWTVFPEAVGSIIEHEYHRAMTGESVRFEEFWKPSWRWLYHECSPSDGGGLTVHLKDVSRCVRAENRLMQYRRIVSTSRDMIAMVNAEFVFSIVNAAFARAFGRRMDEVVGYTVAEIFGEEVFREVLKPRLERCLSGEAQQHREWVEFPAIGRRFMDTTYVAVSTPVGRVTAAVIQARDATELRTLDAQLVQAQRMESVGLLAGGVAHDYNNALSAIIGFAELASDDVAEGTRLHGYLSEILRAAQRTAGITRQLLAFARQQTADPRITNVNAAVDGMLRMLRRLIGENIELTWKPGGDLWNVRIDPSQVDQILANLCVNSRDAIETRNVAFDKEYSARHADVLPGEYVMLAVSDDGQGMAAEVRQRIFEPFFTTKEVGRGTGLGLSTVYGIVRQNSGFVNVYSEPGEGTAFRVYLPRHCGSSEEIESQSDDDIPQGQREVVLLVEDEASLLRLGEAMLEGLGYVVLAAPSPSEAIRVSEKHAGRIDLLISDVVMPKMNGRRLADRLMEMRPKIKTLFVSGYTADAIAHRGVIEDGVHFLQKPFSLRDLAIKVRQMLESAS